MQDQDRVEEGGYRVVVNHEEQYSLLAARSANPAGWRDAGFSGTREACLDYINRHWIDMRPASLRGGSSAAQAAKAEPAADSAKPRAKSAAPRKRKTASA